MDVCSHERGLLVEMPDRGRPASRNRDRERRDRRACGAHCRRRISVVMASPREVRSKKYSTGRAWLRMVINNYRVQL